MDGIAILIGRVNTDTPNTFQITPIQCRLYAVICPFFLRTYHISGFPTPQNFAP